MKFCSNSMGSSLFPVIFATLLFFTFEASGNVLNGDMDVRNQIENAKPGSVVVIPEGNFQADGIRIPSGVTISGAGPGRTILSAQGKPYGLFFENIRDATVKNLTVQGATSSDIHIDCCENVKIDSVVVLDSKVGIMAKDSKSIVVQNVISAHNRIGMGVSKTAGIDVVNCTFAANTLSALSASGGSNGAVFNNIFWRSPVGVLFDKDESGLKLDHNLFWTTMTGRIEGMVARKSLAGWRSISGGDQNSVQFDVVFKDPSNADFTPVNTFDWRPFEPMTADFGVPSFAGVNAPLVDMGGNPRTPGFDLGAIQSARLPESKADGEFTITSDKGLKSAAIFTPDGKNIASLFQNLPLKPGKYPFWLPSRDWQGKRIPAGKYEVRLVESDLRNAYIGTVGNFAKTSRLVDSFSWPEEVIAFDSQDRVLAAQNSFENGTGVRAFDTAYENPRWMVPGGGGTVGAAVDNGLFFYLQKLPGGEHSYNLRKLDVETGEFQEFHGGHYNLRFTHLGPGVNGLALAHGRIYVSDPAQNKVWFTDADNPKFESAFDVPSPTCISYDRKTDVLWVISNNEKLLALNPVSGAVVASFSPEVPPFRMNTNNGRLAFLSRASGKVHIFDVSTPSHVIPLREIGTGDGPYGKIEPDRFWFQSDGPQAVSESDARKESVSINSKGDVAVIDSCRVLFWGADGKLIRQGIGVWGQHITSGKLDGDDRIHLWAVSGDYDFALDAKTGKWEPNTHWKLPRLNYPGRSPVGFFTKERRNFALHAVTVKSNPANPADSAMAVAVIEFEGAIGKARTLYFTKPGIGLVVQHDDNGDGTIDEKDTATPLLAVDGKPLPDIPFGRYNFAMSPDGALMFPAARGALGLGMTVPFGGFDAKGNPIYDWAKARVLTASLPQGGEKVLSPYDFKTEEAINSWVMQQAPLSDGGLAQCLMFKSSGGTGLQNGAGTEIAGFNKNGELRWVDSFSYAEGVQGVQTIPSKKLMFTMWAEPCDYLVMNEDGLGLGTLSMTADSNWKGMWSDHAQQQQAFLGNDGKPYYVLGDYAMNCYHWFAILGTDEIKQSTTSFELSEARATELAGLPLPQPALKKWCSMPPTEILVKKLKEPLPIDGNPNTWGEVVPPSVVLTPELAAGDIDGPQDCSATIRLAWMGEDLYVQTIVFDDQVLFHQPSELMYKQDGIEMAINGYMEGFKFDAAKTTDRGDTIHRNRFFPTPKFEKFFDPASVPRAIKVLDTSAEVKDRKLLEDATGKDLSKCHAIVTQFKIPMTDSVGGEGSPETLPKPVSGNSFWLGFFINDNDKRGGDVQDFIAWPSSYSPFATKQYGAHATFE